MKKSGLGALVFGGIFLMSSAGCSLIPKKEIQPVISQEIIKPIEYKKIYHETFCGGNIIYEMNEDARRDMVSVEQLAMYNDSADGGTTLKELTDSRRHALYIQADVDKDKVISPVEARNAYEQQTQIIEDSRFGTNQENSVKHLKK